MQSIKMMTQTKQDKTQDSIFLQETKLYTHVEEAKEGITEKE